MKLYRNCSKSTLFGIYRDEDDDSDAGSNDADEDMELDENKNPDDEYNFDNYDNEGEQPSHTFCSLWRFK